MQTGTTGVTTDIDGKYTVTVDAKGTLTFSYIGFKSQSIKVDGRTQIDVELIESSENLDELVVVGYGVVKKSDLRAPSPLSR